LKPDVSTVAAKPRSERTVKSLGLSLTSNKVQSKTSQFAYCLGTPEAIDQNQTGSGMYHPIVKEQVLPGQLEGVLMSFDITDA
jgi:hypothetical protein